jgi:hypothetical protein
MAVISIINDSFKLGDTKDKLVIEGIFNYIDVYTQIVNALNNNVSLDVLVRDSTCFTWLSRLKEQYGSEYIKIYINTPRNILRQKWNLQTLPDDITDRQILDASLLKLEISPKRGENFQNIILEKFYSSFLTFLELPISRLTDLLNDLVKDKKLQNNRKTFLVYQQYEKRFDEWAEKAKDDGIKDLIENIKSNPENVRIELMKYKLVKNYPIEISEHVLGERYDTFQKLNLDLKNLPIEEAKLKRTINEIEIFLLNELKIKTLKDLEELITTVSGELAVEFNEINKLIYYFKDIISKELINRIKDKFTPISDQISAELRRLDFIIPPLKPAKPNITWEADQWLEWAINSYLPYQFWLEEQNLYDKEIATFSEMFADWFYKNFIELKSSFPKMLHKAVVNICHEIRNSKGVGLFIAIDNFNFKYINILRSLFRQRQFICEEPQGYFSMVPTETEVCKKCLFSGESERAAVKNRTYKQIIEEDWSIFLSDKKIKYLPNLGALKKKREKEYDMYFLNYCNVDELLHKDEDELGVNHLEKIYNELDNLVCLVIDFSKRLKIEDKLSIYICSDHGSTKIQEKMPNYIDRKYYNNKSEDKHHRFVTVSDSQIDNLPSHVESNCYVIKKDEFGLTENTLIAKGYSRFVRTTTKYYVHGGLSPEEVIVPFIVFRKIAEESKEILFYLEQNIFRYSVKSSILFNLGNINDYEINNVEIGIRNSNIESEYVKFKRIKAKEKINIEIPARFKKTISKKESEFLMARISYQFLGKTYIQDKEFSITMKSIIQRKADLDDIFD